jgi:hypothetical protein
MPKQNLSERKLAANRANAQKSTGPRTPQGKARSSMNAVKHGRYAVKHGLFAQAVVLPDDRAESPAELNQMRIRLREEIAPTNLMEELIVERLLACHWRLRRAYRFEAIGILELRDDIDDDPESPHKGIVSPSLGHCVQLPRLDECDHLLRYETMLDRTIHRLTNQLIRLRAKPIACSIEPSTGSDSDDTDENNVTERTQTEDER